MRDNKAMTVLGVPDDRVPKPVNVHPELATRTDAQVSDEENFMRLKQKEGRITVAS